MKRIWLPLLLLTFSAVASAQPATTTAPAAPQNPAIPRSKIAVIYSGAFQDPKEGIARFAATINKLNAEFLSIQNDLNQTSQRLRALQDEISKMQQGATPATPAQIQAKLESLDDQKKQYQRRG